MTWVPDPEEGFMSAQIKSTKGDMVTVITAKGQELTLKKDLMQVIFTFCDKPTQE